MSDSTYVGQRGPAESASHYNNLDFLVRQAISLLRTVSVTQVIAVHGGGVGKAPTVDVKVLVRQMSGDGTTAGHDVIYGIPCTRNQGGKNAIINDPIVGDIGLHFVSDRDISSVKASNGQEAPPGSYRRHNLSDGVFHPLPLGSAAPTQYTHYKDQGVDRVDNQGNTIATGASGIAHTTTQDNAAATTTTNGQNAPINHTTEGTNSNVSISAMGTGSSVALSSATGISLSAPSLSLPSGGVSSSALASGAAASNVGSLGGDLSGSLPNANVIGASTIPVYTSNAAAITGGLTVGKLYANNTISGSEHVLCVVH